jgi:hypothetical protein
MLRRLSGALAWLLLLNVSVERADRACATHGWEAPAAGSHAQHATSGHHESQDHPARTHGTPGHEGSDEACKIPRSAECCQAAASCSVTLSSETKDGPEASLDDARAIADPLGHALRGSPAPDTPPPKA